MICLSAPVRVLSQAGAVAQAGAGAERTERKGEGRVQCRVFAQKWPLLRPTG